MIDPQTITEAKRALGRQLAALREAGGKTQGELAQQINYGRSTIANAETGYSTCRRTFWEHTDQALHANGALLAGYDELQTLTRQRHADTARFIEQKRTAIRRGHDHQSGAGSMQETSPTGPSAYSEGRPLDAVGRGRTAIAEVDDGGRPGVGEGLDGSMSERLGFVLKYSRRVDLLTAAYLREQVQELDRVYDRTPATTLLGRANRLHGRITFLRDHAPVGRVRRDLLAAVTESATLVGQLVWDASQRRDHTASIAYFDQAIESAQLLRDDVAESNGWLRKNFVALYGAKDPRMGLGLAGRAANGADGVSHVVNGLAQLHMAEAHAMLGQTTSCEAMLARAETAQPG